MAPAPAAGPIVKEITCIIGGILLTFNIDNPLTKLCPTKSTVTITSGVTTSTKGVTTSSKPGSITATTTISIGTSTSVVLPDSTTLTVPTTTSSTIVAPTTTSTSVQLTTSTSVPATPSTSSSSSSSSSSPSGSSSSSTSTTPTSTSTTAAVPTTSSSLSTLAASTSTTSTSSSAAPTSTQYDAFNCPAGLPLSCHNTTAIDNTCCFESPGGLILQTQFWDTNPATGPNNSWTVHGLWPDNCDGTYQQYCDPAREYTNITQILQSFGKTDLLNYMNEYWTSNSGTAESFWEHEFGKHGTCMSTFDTECYPNYVPTQEVPDFFQKTVDTFKTLPSYDWLAAAGIVPSTTATYNLQDIVNAVSGANQHGAQVYVGCYQGQIDELWYYYYVQGSIQTGTFQPTDLVGAQGCPATGIYYYPKGYVPPSTSTTPTATATSTGGATGTAAPASSCPTSTSTAAPFTSGGYLYVQTSANTCQGFMISGGTWYNTAGTPATYTPTASTTNPGLFTLKSSKGPCAVAADSTFSCAAANAAGTLFGSSGSLLTYNGSTVFGATATPSGQTQQPVFAATEPVVLSLLWVSK